MITLATVEDDHIRALQARAADVLSVRLSGWWLAIYRVADLALMPWSKRWLDARAACAELLRRNV